MSLVLEANNIENRALYRRGLRLASIPMAQGGWSEMFSGSLDIDDPVLKGHTAMMLENAKEWIAGICRFRKMPTEGGGYRYVINEDRMAAMLGGFTDHLFPVIRASFPTNVTNDLFAVQPTTRRNATVTYIDYVYGKTRGNIAQGRTLFSATQGVPYTAAASYQAVAGEGATQDYSRELIRSESVANTGSTTTFTGTLTWINSGIKPGTVTLTLSHNSTTIVVADNSRGEFTIVSGSATISSSSINYATGAIVITVASDNFAASGHLATYAYYSEGGSAGRIQMRITTASLETERRALEAVFPLEASQDVSAEFGLSLESELVAVASQTINHETARQLISHVWRLAPVLQTFSKTFSGISMEQHYRSLIYTLNLARLAVTTKAQMADPNWLVVDDGAASIITSLPRDLWEPAPKPANKMGVFKLGTLNGHYAVYHDRWLANELGAVSAGNILMGYKGTNPLMDAGVIWVPQHVLYTTDTLTTSDFVSQKGLASRYAAHTVNPNMYARISITA